MSQAIGDVSGNGYLDLVAASDDLIVLYENSGSGFTKHTRTNTTGHAGSYPFRHISFYETMPIITVITFLA
jgi:hypothetical protein